MNADKIRGFDPCSSVAKLHFVEQMDQVGFLFVDD